GALTSVLSCSCAFRCRNVLDRVWPRASASRIRAVTCSWTGPLDRADLLRLVPLALALDGILSDLQLRRVAPFMGRVDGASVHAAGRAKLSLDRVAHQTVAHQAQGPRSEEAHHRGCGGLPVRCGHGKCGVYGPDGASRSVDCRNN